MSFELIRLEGAIHDLQSSVNEGTEDNRMKAIVRSLEAVAEWISKFEREVEELRDRS
jgi:hypothetical protein